MAQAGQPGFNSRQVSFFLFSVAARQDPGTNPTPIQPVPGYPSKGVKWSEHEADHSSPSNTEIKLAAISPLHRMFENSGRSIILGRSSACISALGGDSRGFPQFMQPNNGKASTASFHFPSNSLDAIQSTSVTARPDERSVTLS
jgi:hypothetical protein